MVDLVKLEELAKAATPGPWQNAPDGYRVFNLFNERMGTRIKLICWTANNKRTRVHPNKANADFIAAANPSTVLELIAALTSALAEIERLREAMAKKDEALEPFADLAQHFTNAPEEGWLWRGEEPLEITVGDLRRAAAAIGEKEPRT